MVVGGGALCGRLGGALVYAGRAPASGDNYGASRGRLAWPVAMTAAGALQQQKVHLWMNSGSRR